MHYREVTPEMSVTIVEPTTPRLHRPELAMPGSSPQLFEEAGASAAAVYALDTLATGADRIATKEQRA